MDDWRLRWQDEYLSGVTLYRVVFPDFWKMAWSEKNAFYQLIERTARKHVETTGRGREYLEGEKIQHFFHDHCDFCMKDVATDMDAEFYCTNDFQYWVCPECFRDFCEKFGWQESTVEELLAQNAAKRGSNMDYNIIRLSDRPDMKQAMAQWFHEKWGVPLEAYMASMDECLSGTGAVPEWYVALNGEHIVGGMGVIKNDFHNRPDCAPNICAVYTEPEYRGRGICGQLLEYVCRDMQARGIYYLYLVTDHIGFYERYGWEFCWMVRSDGEDTDSRMYYRSTALDEVYRRVKDMGDIRMRSSKELDEGYDPDFPIICGEGFRLYEYGGDFVFDYRMLKGNWILHQRKGEWNHSHPQDVEEAVEWIKEYIEGTFC